MKLFDQNQLNNLYRPTSLSTKGDNGQVTIIGGSTLFHGAPVAALKVASRVVDVVFFSSPESSIGEVAAQIKSQLTSFIWIPWNETEEYIKKSNAVLIGPGFMRFRSEKLREECLVNGNCGLEAEQTREITENLLKKYPEKSWVIDAGSLQTMSQDCIPEESILTPNRKEFEKLFELPMNEGNICLMAEKHQCIIVGKMPETIISSPQECRAVKGGNAGLTKGNTGDVVAGLTVALAAQNEPFFAACAASWIVKKAADELYEKVGFAYNSEDLILKIPEVLGKYYK